MSMRILFISANPKWEDRLELGDELRTLLGSLKGQDVDLMLLPAAQPEDLKIALGSTTVDIVHFSGHAEEEGILLRDADGFAKQLPGAELSKLLHEKNVRLAVLNACSTKTTGEEIKDVVGAVVSTTDLVADDAARKLTKVLYASLRAGQPISAAFDEAVATLKDADLTNVYISDGAGINEKIFEGERGEGGEHNLRNPPEHRQSDNRQPDGAVDQQLVGIDAQIAAGPVVTQLETPVG